jgi:hypothetical protein
VNTIDQLANLPERLTREIPHMEPLTDLIHSSSIRGSGESPRPLPAAPAFSGGFHSSHCFNQPDFQQLPFPGSASIYQIMNRLPERLENLYPEIDGDASISLVNYLGKQYRVGKMAGW